MSSSPDSTRIQCYLTEVKDGIQVAQHALGPVTVLGRAEDADIVLAHQSCSRKHATIYLEPLSVVDSSTHGTFVGKHKVQGSMALQPGCVLQFGASTRLYFVEEAAPQPTDSPVNKPLGSVQGSAGQQDALRSSDNAEGRRQILQLVDQTSFSLDDFFRDESQVPAAHVKEWERYKARKYKLEHIQQESSRIRAKGDDLTEGQQRQLERNREREEQLRAALDEAEQTLLRKLIPESSHRDLREESSVLDDDEVDDRTGHNCGRLSSEAETEATLTAKFKSLLKQIELMEQKATIAKQNHVDMAERVLHLEEAGDDEEAFFARNDLNLLAENLRKLESEQRSLESLLKETTSMLRLANPRLTIDPVTGYVGHGLPTLGSAAPPRPSNPHRTQSATCTASDSSTMMPPPPRKVNEMDAMPPPPPKRVRLSQPSVPLSAPAGINKTMPTADSASSLASPKAEATIIAPDAKNDTWRVPAGQDGSGRTKLNQKFAGRY